jgi:ADP-ribose pyrophosphatase YjhB (NUDIX family)
VLGNHDRPRVATKRGQAQARVAAMLLLTLRGTPTLYYGDELGLTDVAIPPAEVQDPRELREPGLALGRDPVRTPMPWDASANAGFTTAKPWLPLNADWPTRNVARMTTEPHSILRLYRRLLATRRAHPALSIGGFALPGGGGQRARICAPAWRGASHRGAQSRRTAASVGVAGLGGPVSAALGHCRRCSDGRRRCLAPPGGRGRDSDGRLTSSTGRTLTCASPCWRRSPGARRRAITVPGSW